MARLEVQLSVDQSRVKDVMRRALRAIVAMPLDDRGDAAVALCDLIETGGAIDVVSVPKSLAHCALMSQPTAALLAHVAAMEAAYVK